MPGSGFRMIHRDGLEVCHTPGDFAALVWLCRQGYTFDWGKPFEATNADLCRASGCGRGWVRGFLRRMAGAGVVVIVETGDKHHPRTLLCTDPRPTKVIHDPDHNPDHNGDHQGAGSSGDMGPGDSRPGPPPGSPGRQSVDLEERSEKEDQRADEREATDRLWEHWRGQRRPGGDKPGRLWHTSRHFDDDDRRKLLAQMRARAKSHRAAGFRFPADLQAAESDCRDLVDCFHQSPACRHWQGENDGRQVYLGLRTLFKRDGMGTRWETSSQWVQDGRPRVSAQATPANGYKGEAEGAWSWVRSKVAAEGLRLARPLVKDEAKERALWSGIQAAGGVQALCGRTDKVDGLRWPFVRAYVEERQRETT